MKRGLKFLIVLALSAVLIFGVVCISSFATGQTETPKLQITACTLSFDDSVYIMYALPIDSTAGAEVKMLYFTEPQDTLDEYNYENAKYRESHIGVQNVFDKDSYVYKNKHMNAKNMTDVIYARAYAKVGDTEYYSNLVKYSILEYAYNMLGYTADYTPPAKLEKLLKTMLTYGAASQEYFTYKTDRLATDEYYKVSVVGGRLSDCSTKGFYKSNETLTLTATPSDEGKVVRWYDSLGALRGEGETLTVSVKEKNESYTAVWGNATITGVSFNDVGYVYDGSEKTLLIEGELPEGVTVEYTGNVGIDAGAYEATATVSGDGYDTLVLHATLTIDKADITGIVFSNRTFKYKAGQTHTVKVSGTLPDGVEVVYANNSASYVGTYVATATISGKNYNTLVLTATFKITSSSSGGIVTPEHSFT